MRRNISALFVVCVGYGLACGLGEFALPFYLRSRGRSFAEIGLIFSFAAFVLFFLRLYLARLSDLLGRKLFYVGSLVVTAFSYLAFPFVRALAGLAALKVGTNLSFAVRDTAHATALYESRREGYLNLQGKTRGVEMGLRALGTLVAGYLLFDYRVVFGLAFVVLVATAVLFGRWFEEPADLEAARRVGLRELLTRSFPREIKILALSGFIFGVALSASHYYIPPLFFTVKFGLSKPVVGQIQLVHVLSHVPGLFLVGWVVRRRLKAVFFWTMLLEGVLIGLVGCFESLGPTLFFWWTHDIVGAGFWAPVQWTLIQRYARQGSRGLDSSVVPAVTALGCIVGPLMAGYLAGLERLPLVGVALSRGWALSLPMVFSGAIIVVASVPLLLLPADEARERGS